MTNQVDTRWTGRSRAGLDVQATFAHNRTKLALDSYLMNPTLDSQRMDAPLALAAEWAPAYELLMSFGCFAFASQHPNLEIGQAWVKQVRHSLPAPYVEQI